MAITDGYKVLIGADTTKLVTDVQNATSKMTATVKVDADGNSIKQLNTEVKTFTDSSGRMWQNVEKTSQAINSQTGELEGNKKVISSTTKEITKASTATKTWGDKFVDITKKVIAFGTATQIIMLFRQAMDLAKDAVFEFDASITELIKVTDLGGESLERYKDSAYALADELNTSAINITDAVTEFSKSGFDLDDALTASESAVKFQTIADEALSAAESSEFLIQTIKAFNYEASEAENIIDKVNAISNNYAVSSSDLSQSIGKVASSAQLAKVDFNELLGLITSSTEITQNASKSANGFKTILVNLVNKDLEEQFNKFGLTTRDVNGALKDGYTIVKELSEVYNSMPKVFDETTEALIPMNDELNLLLEDIAGKHNINVLTASLSNFGTAINVVDTAMNSAGSANQEYERAMDSLSGKCLYEPQDRFN